MPNYTIDRKTEHFHTLESYFALERKPIESKKQIKRVRATQDRRVRQLMRAAYDIPFYRQRFEESGTKPEDYSCAEDLYQFPLLTKDDLRAWMSGEETEHPEKYEAWHVAPTSGSTGKPLRTLFSPRENAWLTANWLRVMSYGGYNPFTGKTMSRPNVLHGAKGGHDSIIQKLGILRRGFISNMNDTHLDTQVIVDEINAYQPDYLYIHRYLMVRIAKHVKETGGELWRPKFYTPIGEMVDAPTRALLLETYGPGLIDSYGLAETGSCVVRVMDNPYYQVNSDLFAVNIYDDAQSGPADNGMAVVTPLYKLDMPIINYVTYDSMNTFMHEGLRFVERIRGRMNDMVYHRDGRISVAEHFMTVMNFMPEVIAWRAVQEDYEHITMLLVRNPDVAEQEQEAISRRIVDGLAKTLDDPTFKITCTWMNDIPADPSGKLRLVVSKMKKE